MVEAISKMLITQISLVSKLAEAAAYLSNSLVMVLVIMQQMFILKFLW
jgi:hypothetical protein